MPNPALDAGIVWKLAVVGDRLAYAAGQLAQHAADPSAQSQSQVPGDQALVERYVDELRVLGGPDKGKAWDLVKRNVENGIRRATNDLAKLEGYFAGKDHIFPEGGELAELRRVIENLRSLLANLEAEGRP
jgi:hypothetical protein